MGAWVIYSGVASLASEAISHLFCLGIDSLEKAIRSFCSVGAPFLDQDHHLKRH